MRWCKRRLLCMCLSSTGPPERFNQTAQVALAQLRANGYGEPYRASGRAVMAIGANRDGGPVHADTRTLDDWQAEPL